MTATPRRLLAVVRNPVGGIRKYIQYTYGAFTPGRYQFTVLAVKSGESVHLHEDLSALGARIIEVEHVADLPKAVMTEVLSGRHDLVHSHGLKSAVSASPAAWATALLPFFGTVPHVVTSHDVFVPAQFVGAKAPLAKMFLTFILNRATAVHSVSPGAEKNLLAYLPGVRAGHRSVVMNGIPPVVADNADEAKRWRLEMAPHGEILFGFFGRFMPQKGFEDVIAAAALLQKDPAMRDRFRIAAMNAGSYIRERRADVERLGLAERFVFAGASTQPRALMERVDAVVMPSLWEACGLVGMETLAAGTPLISTAVDGLADVTAGSPALVVAPHDPESLSRAMAKVISESAALRLAAQAYKEAAQRRFDVATAAAGLERIFDHVL